MGLIGKMLGISGAISEIGAAATNVSGAFVPNATQSLVEGGLKYRAALGQYQREFQTGQTGAFDRVMNAVNRLPRPMLALGTIGLFVYAMSAPQSFSVRMQGLAYVPQPLWWLLGAVVSFYFGAREMSYFRGLKSGPAAIDTRSVPLVPANRNAALEEWDQDRGR